MLLSSLLPILFRDERGKPFSLRQLSGRPFMLVRLPRWDATPGEEATLRAQLRGLGAELVVLHDDGATHLRPDDVPIRLTTGSRLPAASGFEVMIVGADLRVRGTQTEEAPREGSAQTLLAALERAVHQPGAGVALDPWRREVLLGTLVSAFAWAIAGSAPF